MRLPLLLGGGCPFCYIWMLKACLRRRFSTFRAPGAAQNWGLHLCVLRVCLPHRANDCHGHGTLLNMCCDRRKRAIHAPVLLFTRRCGGTATGATSCHWACACVCVCVCECVCVLISLSLSLSLECNYMSFSEHSPFIEYSN